MEETYYQKNKEKILAKQREKVRLKRLEQTENGEATTTSIIKLCFPRRIKNTKNYKAFHKQYREEFPATNSEGIIIELPKTDIAYREKRKLELLKEYGIVAPTPKCDSRCPYKKECQKETAEIRKAFLKTELEHVWMPFDNVTRYHEDEEED